MTYDYKEKRTKHALAVDRGKNAKARYSTFNEKYGNKPNRSDVFEYDTRPRKEGPGPDPQPKTPEQPKDNTDYQPTDAKRVQLMTRFHALPPMQQHKDLLTTRNVLKSHHDVDKWVKNPRQYDIRGIDTQPPELVEGRISVAHKLIGSPVIKYGNWGWTSRRGQYDPRFPASHPGEIKMRKGLAPDDDRFVRAHEIGHGYDRNIINKVTHFTIHKGVYMEMKGAGAVDFGNMRGLNLINLSFGQENASRLKIDKAQRVNKSKVRLATENKINPYKKAFAPRRFITYRNSKPELFANWFGGMITGKGTVKKETRGFYNIFKKANKPLMKGLRKSDRQVTSKYIKTNMDGRF